MATEWMPLSEVLDRAIAAEGQAKAMKLVREAVEFQSVEIRALSVVHWDEGGDGSVQKRHTRNVEVAPDIWRATQIDWAKNSGQDKASILLEPLAAGRRTAGTWFLEELRAKREDVDRLWPSSDARSSPSGSRAHRPREIDWESILIELARINYHEGLPPKQAAVINRIQLWYAAKPESGAREPGRTELSKRISTFYRAINSET